MKYFNAIIENILTLSVYFLVSCIPSISIASNSCPDLFPENHKLSHTQIDYLLRVLVHHGKDNKLDYQEIYKLLERSDYFNSFKKDSLFATEPNNEPEYQERIRSYFEFLKRDLRNKTSPLKKATLIENLKERGYKNVDKNNPFESIRKQSNINLTRELNKIKLLISNLTPDHARETSISNEIGNNFKLNFYHNSHHDQKRTGVPIISSRLLTELGFPEGFNSGLQFNSNFLKTDGMIYFFPRLIKHESGNTSSSNNFNSEYGTSGLSVTYSEKMNNELGFISPFVMYESDLMQFAKALSIGAFNSAEQKKVDELLKILTRESYDEAAIINKELLKRKEKERTLYRDSQYLMDFTPEDFIILQKNLVHLFILKIREKSVQDFENLLQDYYYNSKAFEKRFSLFQKAYFGFNWEFKIPSLFFGEDYGQDVSIIDNN